MAQLIRDRVRETSTTTGTGSMTMTGAVTGYQTWSGSGFVNNDTGYYCIEHQSAAEWEVGLGTWTTGGVLVRTTPLAGSAATPVNFTSGTKHVFLTDPASAQTRITDLTAETAPADADEVPLWDASASTTDKVTLANLKTYNNTNELHPGYSDYTSIVTPATPSAGTGRRFARTTAGRVLSSWIAPSGVAYDQQPAIFGNQVQVVTPATGTTAGNFMGGNLTSAGTVSHPTPTNTSPATRMRRIRHANVVTTTNQVLGFHGGSADMASYFRGNASGVGGFFFFARFSTALWAANTCRIFVGLRSGTTAVVASDTLAGHLCGFWHDTTVGGTTINFTTRDGTTSNSTAITIPTLAADLGFDAYIYCPPNGSSIFYRLDTINDGTTRVDSSTTTNLPGNTTFLAPECAMSNGTANITVTTVAIAMNKIYIESDV